MSELIAWPARRKPQSLRAIRWLGLPVVQSLLLVADSAYDLVRYLRFFTPTRTRTRERRRLEILITVYYHKIEKTLALARPPELFGTSYLGTLIGLLDRWEQTTRDPRAVVFRGALGALLAYRERVGERLVEASPALLELLDRCLVRFSGVSEGDVADGGTQRLTAADFAMDDRAFDFERLTRARHSVRNFSARSVPDTVITRAVEISQRTPSDCNRQPWRVHVYSSPEDKQRVLRVQNGNSGFGHLASRVLLICADARAFVTSGERHQPYVDAGMFAMSLVYSLQSEGVASCCLNLSRYWFQDMAVRKACRIPGWELPIMMIAIGYPPTQLEVAVSARVPVADVLSWRTL